MKPARFILNSDYTTVRNTGYKEMSVTIPDNFVAPYIDPHGQGRVPDYVIGRSSVTFGESTDCFYVYLTSSRYDYASSGTWGLTKPDGSSATSSIWGPEDYAVSIEVNVRGNVFELEVFCTSASVPENILTYSGFGQTITAHILTFKDPFSE